MTKIIKVNNNWNDQLIPLYDYDEIQFEEGLNVLVGCNGTGKSTLLHQLQCIATKDKIPMKKYDNYNDGGHTMVDQMLNVVGDPTATVARVMASEGENIRMNIGRFISDLRDFILSPSDETERLILIDGIDSGLSIDGIEEVKHVCARILRDSQKRGIKTYIIASANTYALAENSHCINITTGESVKFADYADYADFIKTSFKLKLERLSKENKLAKEDFRSKRKREFKRSV